MDTVDWGVIGGGVIGLAVGRALAKQGQGVVLMEAAPRVGTGASSRNSEVIHGGIYYPTGSLKARLCVAGRRLLYAYCAEKGITHRPIGKLILATQQDELQTLERYWTQARANGVDDLTWLEPAAVAALEPEVYCVGALSSPSTGILDSHQYLLALQADLEAKGGQVVCNSQVTRVDRSGGVFGLSVNGSSTVDLRCRQLINAAGLGAQSVAHRIEGLGAEHVPPQYLARGHYYILTGSSPFKRLIYPVASSGGLGLHVTLDLAGRARFGPDVQWLDTPDYRFDPNTLGHFVASIRRYYPALDEARLKPSYTGIRAKLSGPGAPAADFMVQGEASHGIPGLINLYGIESPGLTAALALADYLVGG